MKRTSVSETASEKKERSIRSLRKASRLAVLWHRTNDPLLPFRADVGSDTWHLKLNDFPEEHMYTLLVNSREVDRFDDWPKTWKDPEAAVSGRKAG